MTVLAALIAGACGPPIDRMQDQLSEAHDALPEVNEIYAALDTPGSVGASARALDS